MAIMATHEKSIGYAGFLFAALLVPSLCVAAGKEREVPREEFLAGEVLRIDIPTDTASPLEGYYPIDGAGLADLPISGRIVVAGKTRANIEQYLGGIWAPFLKDTHVMARPMIRVAVNGNVHNPGFYYASPDAVLFDVIKLAGGPVNPYKIEDMEQRRGGDKVKGGIAYAVSREQTLREIGIQSGDEIVLPIGEHIGWTQGIPLVATTLTVIISSITLYYITVDRAGRAQ
jgi:protein involved in polysaccharide export with SLBB domain